MDRIYYLKKGEIVFVGTYDELLKQKFFKELNKLKRQNSKIDDNNNQDKIISSDEEDKLNDNMFLSEKYLNKLIQEEEIEEGSVKLEVYIKYCKYMGGISFIILIIVSMIIWQSNKSGSDLWLAYWTKNQDKFNKNSYKKWVFFGVYSFLGLMSIVFVFVRLCILIRGTLKLAKNLHKDMIDNLIKAPVNLFHETIPRGQILNRLSKDLEELNYTMFDIANFLVGLSSCIGAMVLCSIYDSYSIIYIPILSTFGYFLIKFYIVGSRSLTRLEAISHSPVLNTIGETIPGIISIRAFEKEINYLRKFYEQNNNQIKINIFIQGCYNWYKEQFDFISFLYLCYLVISTIIFNERFTVQSVGIMFSYSILMQEYLAWTFSLTSQIENKMVSMERSLHYTKIIKELPSILPHDEELKQKNWPNEGKIKFVNYSVRYRPNTEIVLNNLNFEIEPLQKIGVVGRTGSGKSTICLCLFRILEPLKGKIYIDNEDITKIGLDLLRSNITIIPQDPCLFEGNLRYNIDPFKKNNDDEIINILKKIGFEYNEPDNEILDKMIQQNGTNLSVGEKQLICIARAMIRKTKIIVMDEATANIDMRTEEKIQRALEIVFKNSTVITVAHRIKTIINYDKILVLDKGNVMEFDSPQNLLKNENSLFFKLYNKSTL
jgi:ATP-binding cassette subfamily C (CFTR/MRP) protein 1